MPLGLYACCKHGPGHRGERKGGCGFAHSLSELRIPVRPPPQVWRDLSHSRKGPAGIDWFLGQRYSSSQWQRLWLYLLPTLDDESVPRMPPWARRLRWFMDMGEPDEYVQDADFSWAAELMEYLDLAVVYDPCHDRPLFPFDLQWDHRDPSMSLHQRMVLRMTEGRCAYMRYRARVSWQEAHKFVLVTGPSRCRYDRQYLSLEGGAYYVRILVGSVDASWWYVVPQNALPKILSRGGWAPSVYFAATGDTVDLYEVPLDVIRPVSAQSAAEEVAAPLPLNDRDCICVHVYGSADDGRGIAAACVSTELRDSLCASLALPGMTGSECSALLGIVLGLWVCYHSRLHTPYRHSRFVLLVDCQNAIAHVFQNVDPTNVDGWHLYPAILLARELVSLLGGLGIQVSCEKMASGKNQAYPMARADLQDRRDGNWATDDDDWPDALPRVFQDVWRDVARNRRGEGMDTDSRNKCYAPLRYKFTENVSSALASVARGDA